MSKSCLVLGQTNVGKTLFVLNFANYLGQQEVKLAMENSVGASNRVYDLAQARAKLVKQEEHTTKGLQWVKVQVPYRKGAKEFMLMDSTGIIDGIHPDQVIRKGMAQTLKTLAKSKVVLHFIDPSQDQYLSKVDREILRLGSLRTGYAVIINKIDLVEVRLKLNSVIAELQGHSCFPISALTREGFSEVKRFVVRNM